MAYVLKRLVCSLCQQIVWEQEWKQEEQGRGCCSLLGNR